MRAVYKEMIELSVIEVELPAIEPNQERSLRAQRMDEWQVFAAVSFHKQYVFFHIAEHFPSPWFPVAEGCYSGDGCKDCRFIQFVGSKPVEVSLADVGIDDDGPTAHDSCNVERLGRSTEGDADFCGFIRDGGKGNVLMTEKSHVTMNLIADDQHLMAVADIGELYECIFAPHDTRWIVGIAENQHTAFGVLFQDVFQSLEIHVIVAVAKSSAATLPVTMQSAEERLGAQSRIARFVLPICTTINMNGCAAFILVTSLFVMQNGGIPLTWTTMLLWLLVSVISAVGNAGVPMGCYFLTFSLMSGIGAPVSVLGIILPIYTIIDMIETAENVWSDSCVCAMVNKTQLS